MSVDVNQHAERLFAPLAHDYDRWSRLLSFGQDPRWRRAMVTGMELNSGMRVLDVAAGTGQVSSLLRDRSCRVISLDQSPEMLQGASRKGFSAILANAEALPFKDESFDALTFTYLLRYVSDKFSCLRELARVVRSGGVVGMVEFGRPGGVWGPPWMIYTRVALPLVGSAISPGWGTVGRFLGPSIDELHQSYSGDQLRHLWESAGFTDVRLRTMSLGGGL